VKTTEPRGRPVRLVVNGESVAPLVPPSRLLLDLLRETLGLTGCKRGCETGVCGCCTVLVDGRNVKSCLTLAITVEGCAITTIEALAQGDRLHPVQAAFVEHGAAQCGYCTPGMIMSCVALLDRDGRPDETAVREGLRGNLCRCTGYVNIVKAVLAAAAPDSAAR
jgi:carbon-monoxide dehydrogenase small subunit